MRCEVPTYTSEAEFGNRILKEPANLRKLARLFEAEAEGSRSDNDFERAAKSCIDIFRMYSSIRGGITIHRLTLVTVGAMGQRGLLRLLPLLPAEVATASAKELQEMLKHMEAPEATFKRDREFERRVYGTMKSALARFASGSQRLDSQILLVIKARETALRLTPIELAIQSFKVEQKRLPKNLNELIPKYLADLPSDELSGKPFAYHIFGRRSVVYSVGLNRKDDGGKRDDIPAHIQGRWKDPTFRKAYRSD